MTFELPNLDEVAGNDALTSPSGSTLGAGGGSDDRSRRGVRGLKSWLIWGIVAASLSLTAAALTLRGAAHAPTVRATIETGLTICGLVSVALMWSYWKRTHCLSHALIAIAVSALTLEDFEFLAAPASLGWQASALRSPAFLTVRLVLAAFFAGAALVGHRALAPRRRSALALALVPLICLAIPTAVALSASEIDDWFVVQHGHVVTSTAVALTGPAIALLLLAAMGFLRRGLREQNAMVWVGLGAALILVAGTCLYSLLIPGLTTDSVSAREYMRAGAYALLLIVALRMGVLRSRMVNREVAERERLRLVDDLHDGMAQDLAFIVAQSEWLARDLGSEHPMVVAARRALAFSRTAIVDLSAADASTVREALRRLADELNQRHGIHVRLQIEGDDPGAEERDAVVLIAREAIVNAARHGGASRATVALDVQGPQLMLRVSDDGGGLSGDPLQPGGSGYGLRAMRRRAEAIGGQLRTRRGPDGGLAVEVTVP